MPGNGVTSSLSVNNFLLLSSMDAGQCRQISSDSFSLSLACSIEYFPLNQALSTLIITSPHLSQQLLALTEQERETHTSRDVPRALGLVVGMRQCFQTSKAYSCEPAVLCKSSNTLMPPDPHQEGGETDCV